MPIEIMENGRKQSLTRADRAKLKSMLLTNRDIKELRRTSLTSQELEILIECELIEKGLGMIKMLSRNEMLSISLPEELVDKLLKVRSDKTTGEILHLLNQRGGKKNDAIEITTC